MNDTTVLAAIVAAVVTVVTKFIDAIVARRRDRSTGSLEHRKLLSDDERAFRQAVLDEVKELRDELDKKSAQLDDARAKLGAHHDRALDAERKMHEAIRRAELLEAQINDLRTLHAKITEAKS